MCVGAANVTIPPKGEAQDTGKTIPPPPPGAGQTPEAEAEALADRVRIKGSDKAGQG